MKIAVIGLRTLYPTEKQLSKYLTNEDEIVSLGAKGVDSCVANYAKKHKLKLTEFLPKYELYGRSAPIKRNREIVNYADKIIAFWNGYSKGTSFVIEYCKNINKEIEIVIIE